MVVKEVEAIMEEEATEVAEVEAVVEAVAGDVGVERPCEEMMANTQ